MLCYYFPVIIATDESVNKNKDLEMSTGVWIFCTIIAGFTIWALMDTIKRIRWNIRKNRELGLN
jgi:hypothetical protein